MSFTGPSFEGQFKTLFRPLCLYALRIVDSTEDAEDIVQQAFIDIWEKIQQGHQISDIKSYSYRVVRNRSLDYLSRSRSDISLDEMSEIEDHVEKEQIERSEREAKLWSLIEKLPPERKKIFLFAKRDGLKYSEIAEELGISVKTVENQMSKALKSLKENVVKIYLFLFA